MSDGSRVRDSLEKSGIRQKKFKERKVSGPRSGSIHILVLAQMRDIGHDSARIDSYLFPHTIVHGSDGRSQAKHACVLLAKERNRDRHPELDVPLAFAHLRVRPVRLHDDPHVRVEHLCLCQLLLGEGGSLESRRKHGQRIALSGEATFIRVRRALDLDRVNRR
jgi:hypothetical protein